MKIMICWISVDTFRESRSIKKAFWRALKGLMQIININDEMVNRSDFRGSVCKLCHKHTFGHHINDTLGFELAIWTREHVWPKLSYFSKRLRERTCVSALCHLIRGCPKSWNVYEVIEENWILRRPSACFNSRFTLIKAKAVIFAGN